MTKFFRGNTSYSSRPFIPVNSDVGVYGASLHVDSSCEYELVELNNLRVLAEEFHYKLTNIFTKISDIFLFQSPNSTVNGLDSSTVFLQEQINSVFLYDYVTQIIGDDYFKLKQLIMNLDSKDLSFEEKLKNSEFLKDIKMENYDLIELELIGLFIEIRIDLRNNTLDILEAESVHDILIYFTFEINKLISRYSKLKNIEGFDISALYKIGIQMQKIFNIYNYDLLEEELELIKISLSNVLKQIKKHLYIIKLLPLESKNEQIDIIKSLLQDLEPSVGFHVIENVLTRFVSVF